MTDHTPPLREPIPLGDGVVLRHWRGEDAAAVAAACNDPEIARWIPVPQPYTTAEAHHYIEQTGTLWRTGEAFVLCIDRDGAAVGSISLSDG